VKLSDLYPYWPDAHEELLDAIGHLNEAQLDAKPSDRARAIRDLVVDFLYAERYGIAHLVGQNDYEHPRRDRYPNGALLVDALIATRQVTERVLEPLSREGLRAVRHVPADSDANQPETNMPIAWLIWRLLEQEIAVLGQVRLRLEDQRKL